MVQQKGGYEAKTKLFQLGKYTPANVAYFPQNVIKHPRETDPNTLSRNIPGIYSINLRIQIVLYILEYDHTVVRDYNYVS